MSQMEDTRPSKGRPKTLGSMKMHHIARTLRVMGFAEKEMGHNAIGFTNGANFIKFHTNVDGRDYSKQVLRRMLRNAGISEEEFCKNA